MGMFLFWGGSCQSYRAGHRRAVVRQWTYIMRTRKYDTQNKNCLKSHVLINIRRFSSRIVDFYIKMCKTWLRDPFLFFFRGKTSQWRVLTSCSSNESKIRWVFLLKHNEWKWKEYSIRYYRKIWILFYCGMLKRSRSMGYDEWLLCRSRQWSFLNVKEELVEQQWDKLKHNIEWPSFMDVTLAMCDFCG